MKDIVLPHKHNNQEVPDSIQKELGDIEQFQMIAELFKQLGDTTRIRLFWLLCHCEECVINISSLMDMSSPAVSHHLKQLKAIGLISSRRQGKEMYYKASATPEVQLLHKAIEHLMQITCPDE